MTTVSRFLGDANGFNALRGEVFIVVEEEEGRGCDEMDLVLLEDCEELEVEAVNQFGPEGRFGDPEVECMAASARSFEGEFARTY